MLIGIKGHPKRGEEVIKLLKTLGGRTKYTSSGEEFIKGLHWYITDIGLIDWCIDSRAWNLKMITLEELKKQFPFKVGYKNVKMFTLEEFEKQFPFKVGDKVEHSKQTYLSNGKIVDMKWEEESSTVIYSVKWNGKIKGTFDHTVKALRQKYESN